MGAARIPVLRVVTRCQSLAELVVALEPYTDDESILFGSDKLRPVGSRRRFVLELLDGTAAMRGEVEIVESAPPPASRLRVRLLALDGPGRDLHAAILDRIAGRTRVPSASGTLPVVKIPGKSPTPPIGVPLPRRRADDITPIPAPPPRALATARTRVDELFPAATTEMDAMTDTGERPVRRVVIPDLAPRAPTLSVVPPAPSPPGDRATIRMAGLPRPETVPPRFEIAEHKDTVRMAPLFEHTVSDDADADESF
jgi:hypothetical protein